MKISDLLREKFRTAKRVCVLTGAGISAESGVPTFRGGAANLAVWKGMPFDRISSARMVRENLPEVWEWFDYRRDLLKNCQPNAAHFALAEWQDKFEDFTLVTQNIDGLHQAAGSTDVIELHGNIHRAYCTICEKRFDIRGAIPHAPDSCDECFAPLRPDVVLFGEMLPFDAFETADKSARACELFFVVGTSALVYPAAGLAEIAKRNGSVLVEINPEERQMTVFCDFSLRGKAGDILTLI